MVRTWFGRIRLDDALAKAIEGHAELLQSLESNSLPSAQDAQEQVLGSDVIVLHGTCPHCLVPDNESRDL